MVANYVRISELSRAHFDEEVPAFHLHWDNVLALTAGQKGETVILTVRGKVVIVRQDLRTLLREFCLEHDINVHELHALYGIVGERTYGYIAGHHQLVPTCGACSDRVVYYMAHRMTDYHAVDNGVLIEFEVEEKSYYLPVDTSYKTFIRLMKAGGQVSQLQLNVLQWQMHNYGLPDQQKYSYQAIRDWRRDRQKCQLASCETIVRYLHQQSYGEELDESILRQIHKLFCTRLD